MKAQRYFLAGVNATAYTRSLTKSHVALPLTVSFLCGCRRLQVAPSPWTSATASLSSASLACRGMHSAPSAPVVGSPSSSSPSTTGACCGSGIASLEDVSLSRSTLEEHREQSIRLLLRAKEARLRVLDEIKRECDAEASHYPNRFMYGIGAFLLAQVVVLFDWTYVHFDWNLTEPITYLLGYSATWIAIGVYGMCQSEFSYDALRQTLETSRQTKLYKRRGLDIAEYTRLVVEVDKLEKILRSLEGI